MCSISVVMATYNGEKYIEEQLTSILEQTRKPDEVIVSDDCSSDRTCEIVRKISEKTDVLIKLSCNDKNLGYIKNFKKAISLSNGDYIFLCDQDDRWEKKKIEKSLACINREKAWLACTGFYLIDGKGNVIQEKEQFKSEPVNGYENWSGTVLQIPFKRLLWGNFSPGCTYCFTRDLKQIFDKLQNCEISHDFQLLLVAANMNRAIYIDEPLSCYRLHNSNTVGMNHKEARRKRHLKPRLVKFMEELETYMTITNRLYGRTILYLRLPKIRSVVIKKMHLNNKLKL